ncbi:MAG TPA: hypothetical protein VEI07_04545 [Planctomycetaceae bacterium]|nr:hypothetical protein [Planctomycetaceae bacterium]
MFSRLAVVIRAWTTRRLLWLWAFAYACVLTSGYLRPITPKDAYIDCPRFLLPADAVNPATDVIGRKGQAANLRNVRALIVRDGFGTYANLFPAPAFCDNLAAVERSLHKLPELESIYLGGYGNPVDFGRACAKLPGIRVWHLELNGARLASTIFLLLATLTLGGAVLQQTQAVFSLPHARTVPGFVVPHLLIPLAIAATGIVAASLIARLFGSDFWATAAVQVFAWGAWSAFEFRAVSLSRLPWRRAPQVVGDQPAATGFGAWSGIILLLAIAACLAIFIARPYILESFLLGELPRMAVGFAVIGAALGSAALVAIPTYCVGMNETGATAILSLQDFEKRRIEHGLLSGRFGRRLERLRRPSLMPRWLWQIHAMQSGNPDLLLPVLVRIVVPVALVVALQFYFPLPQLWTAFVLLLLGAGCLIALSHTFSNWWQRRKVFSVELLYPRTRRQLTRSAFAAYAFDALGILAVLFTTLIFCGVALTWPLGMRMIWSGTLVIVLSAALLITGGLWLLTLRHRLLAGFLGIFGVLLLIATMTSAVQFLQIGASPWRVALPFALVALLFGLNAWRRWMKTEWGLFGPP